MSDNDAWYNEFYKQHKRKPNERELLDMAREIYGGGGAKYGTAGIGYENLPDEAQADIDALDRDFETLNVLEDTKDKVSQLTASEMTVTKGLSPSGYRVYQMAREQLAQGNKDVQDSARLNAILFARYADRMAENISKITGKEYTTEDYVRERIMLVPNATQVDERGLNQSAGIDAMTANHKALFEAMQMKDAGASKEEIYDKTGWHLGADGKWRFEIPDNLDMIDEEKIPEFREGVPHGVSLVELYNNLALYQAYPWLENVYVVCQQTKEGVRGYADYTNNVIVVSPEIANNAERFKETLIHEIQHFIQAYEGFARGGSPSTVKKQVDRQYWLYIDELAAIHPKAGSYINLLSRIEKERALNNEWEVEFYGHKKTQVEKEIPPEDVKKIIAVYEKMKKLQENVDYVKDDIYKYYLLHGEQEARNASQKAKLYADIQQFEGKELRHEDDIYKEHRAKIDPTYHKQVDEWYDNRKTWSDPDSSREEVSNAYDRMTEIEEELRDVKQFAEFMQAIDENADLEFALTLGELEEDRAKYKRAVLEGIDEDTAIVVFGDTLVGSYSADEVKKENPRSPLDMFYTVEVTGNEFGEYEDIKDLRKKAVEWYANNLQGTVAYNVALGEIVIDENVIDKNVHFSGNGKKEMKFTSAKVEKLCVVKHLRELIENANFITESVSEKEKHAGEYFYYMYATAIYEGKKRCVNITIKKNRQNILSYYNHVVLAESEYKEKEGYLHETLGSRIPNPSQYSQEAPSVNNSIPEDGEVFNQEKVFYQTAYHGSPHKFDTFNLGGIGTGEGAQAHGWGLYFAKDSRVTNDYYMIKRKYLITPITLNNIDFL